MERINQELSRLKNRQVVFATEARHQAPPRTALHDDAVLIIVEAIDQQWRDYSQAPTSWPWRIERELVYFDEVLAQARGALCLREDAIFALGFSGGGSFAGLLGCDDETPVHLLKTTRRPRMADVRERGDVELLLRVYRLAGRG